MADTLPLKEIEFLTDFRDWARGKNGGYPFLSPRQCACAQFLRETGRAKMPSVGLSWCDAAKRVPVEHEMPRGLNNALVTEPTTFSALAERIDKLIPARVAKVSA